MFLNDGQDQEDEDCCPREDWQALIPACRRSSATNLRPLSHEWSLFPLRGLASSAWKLSLVLAEFFICDGSCVQIGRKIHWPFYYREVERGQAGRVRLEEGSKEWMREMVKRSWLEIISSTCWPLFIFFLLFFFWRMVEIIWNSQFNSNYLLLESSIRVIYETYSLNFLFFFLLS